MASRVRKRLTAAERRARILAAAVRAFALEGYDETAMDRIAARARISKPVLYDHFASKQALFLAVLESIRDGLIADGQSIAASDDDPQQRFRRGVDAFLRFVEQQPDAARVLLTVPRGDPRTARLSRAVQAGASAGIARLLAPYMPDSPPGHLDAATEFLKAGLHAIGEWWLDNPGPSREELVDVVMRIAWSGLCRLPHGDPDKLHGQPDKHE
jgi:AcrR family transcriptional regulator